MSPKWVWWKKPCRSHKGCPNWPRQAMCGLVGPHVHCPGWHCVSPSKNPPIFHTGPTKTHQHKGRNTLKKYLRSIRTLNRHNNIVIYCSKCKCVIMRTISESENQKPFWFKPGLKNRWPFSAFQYSKLRAIKFCLPFLYRANTGSAGSHATGVEGGVGALYSTLLRTSLIRFECIFASVINGCQRC